MQRRIPKGASQARLLHYHYDDDDDEDGDDSILFTILVHQKMPKILPPKCEEYFE